MRFDRPNIRAGFTLLEIALVIVIIILLVLALIPAFRSRSEERRFPVLPAATPAPSVVPEPSPVPGTPIPPLPLDSSVPAGALATPAPADR
jgi:hypothetical protein